MRQECETARTNDFLRKTLGFLNNKKTQTPRCNFTLLNRGSSHWQLIQGVVGLHLEAKGDKVYLTEITTIYKKQCG